MADILHQLSINVSPERVYEAITQQEGLANWWAQDTVAEAKIGMVAEFGFKDREVVFKMRIDLLEANKKVMWQCLGGSPEWEDTTLCFGLTRNSNGTVVCFSHRGWKSTEGIFVICNYDWERYLSSLKSYLETGKEEPHSE